MSRGLQALKLWIPIAIGTAIYAFGLHYFVLPNELMEGGLTGISLLLHYSLDLPISVTTLVLNIPLFILGWKTIGRSAMLYTVLGAVALSFFLWVMEIAIERGWIVPFRTEQDFFLSTLYAGLTLGIGLGIVFRFGGTTGGTDIIASLLSKTRGWSIGQVILAVDVLVIGTSLLYIPKEKVMYTLVAVFVASRTIDFITEGAYSAKAFTIMSSDGKIIAETITRELERGVTLFPAKGAYSQTSKNVVYCVVSRQETRRLKTIVKRIDPNAFIVISDVHDVLGEGFKGR
ncbi:YitT family protein [Paenibacillus ginsengarvi]|uniref:YitT family protein n=1 Tax=Paenibacillus ginsengarvi TaxID=400777 RepID=A0A3B0BHW0_9BACL|nr:YitT family protein [Paenibacillus ginsengarvi]RKN72472.1 YitT family protein [Paenibacillus ginsengarvi]